MENYSTQLLAHLVPLVVIQGVDPHCKSLPTETAVRDVEELAHNPLLVATEPLHRKQQLLRSILFVDDVVKLWRKHHVDGVVWDSNSMRQHTSAHPHRYRFKPIDHYTLPGTNKPSVLSPLTEASPVHPNGILSVDWIQKYRAIVPSVYIAFYSLDVELTEHEDIERADNDLALEISTIKEQLAKRNIKLLAIVVSERSTALNPDLEERVGNIRRSTALNGKSGLLLLSSGTPKEINGFAMDALQVVKQSSLEYYGNLDKVIRKKKAKVLATVGVDPLAKYRTEARYSLKLGFINEMRQQYDYAAKSFESAYQNLIELLNAIAIDSPDWDHTRLLLDIAMFHIVRINFYLEQTNLAYRKFDSHLRSVLQLLERKQVLTSSLGVSSWRSHQFKWLAQLSDLVPTSLVPSDVPFKVDPQNKLSPLVLPHSGFLYLQAVDILKRSDKTQSEKDTYAKGFVNDNFEESLVNLLKFAKLAFQKKDNTFNRCIAYANYQLGEEFLNLSDFEKATKFFEQALDTIKEDDWPYLLSVLHSRLFDCSFKLKKHYASIVNLIEISLLPENNIPIEFIDKIQALTATGFDELGGEELVINTDVESTLDVFETGILIRNPKISLSKSVDMQIKIKSKTSRVLDETVLDDVLLTFEGSLPSILLKHDPTFEEKNITEVKEMEHDSAKNCYIGLANLQFKSMQQKVYTLAIPASKVGLHFCSTVSGTMSYHDLFKVKLSIPIVKNAFKHRYPWINLNGTQDIIATSDPTCCEIVPRVPETKVSLVESPTSAFIGEHLSLGVLIRNKDHENVDAELSAEISIGEKAIDHSWDGSKSRLELKSLEVGRELVHKLTFRVPQESQATEIQLTINVVYYVNHDMDIPIVDSIRVVLPIVDPFKITTSIQPRVREGDLPQIFDIEGGDDAIPKPSRYWLMRTVVTTLLDSGVKVINDSVLIKSGNENIVCRELFDDRSIKTKDNKVESDHFIETVITDGHTYRNVALEGTLSMKWHREGSDVLNDYTHETWRLSLPLLDPRVLLDVGTNEENTDVKVTYLIENPTSRLFSFSTTLIENQSFQVSGTKSQSQLSVLPCTRQRVTFHATPLSSGWLQLPQLKVYDLNYRVNLPTLPITDLAQTYKQEVYVRVD